MGKTAVGWKDSRTRPSSQRMDSVGRRLYRFFIRLKEPKSLPPGIEVMHPYRSHTVREVLRQFFEQYYDDQNKRRLILGINPGRFGGGVTGLAFTDPVALEQKCGLPNPFPKKRELSGTFIYEVVDAMGGCGWFFKRFFLGAVCPLGFLRGGKNFNYYDDPRLCDALRPFIRRNLKRLIACGFDTDEVIVLGSNNARFIQKDPVLSGLFARLTVLEHPRFIMQYRRLQKSVYLRRYCEALNRLATQA